MIIDFTKRIFIKDWLKMKPYHTQKWTDSYYLGLSNKIKTKIRTSKVDDDVFDYFEEKELDVLSCMIASYLEDLVSDTNIWNTFTSLHKEMYGKRLPFYDETDYYEGEINLQDVCFLLWYTTSIFSDYNEFINPHSEEISMPATAIMEVLEEAWEYAPENEDLKKEYELDKNETDYYISRQLINKLLFNTYLFYPDTGMRFEEEEEDTVDEHRNDVNLQAYLNDLRDGTLHGYFTKLLCLKGKEWAAELLGKDHPRYDDYKNLSSKVFGNFLYKGKDDTYFEVEHIASGRCFKVLLQSYPYVQNLKEIDTILFFGIVQWRGEWWFSGVASIMDYEQEIVDYAKEAIEEKNSVRFLEYQEHDVDVYIKEQLAAFLEFNNGKLYANMTFGELDNFIEKYHNYHNTKISIAKGIEKECENKKKLIRTSNFADVFGEERQNEECTVFFNPKSGIELLTELSHLFVTEKVNFKDERDKIYMESDIEYLLMDDDFSAEVVLYWIDNHSHFVGFDEFEVGKNWSKDADFLLRFWKDKNYFSKPEITFY